MAKVCSVWNDSLSNESTRVGLVAGATDLIALKKIRSLAPNVWILCPGVGAQGGDAQVN